MTDAPMQLLDWIYVTLLGHDGPPRWDALDESVPDKLRDVAKVPKFATPEEILAALDLWRAMMHGRVDGVVARYRATIESTWMDANAREISKQGGSHEGA